MESLMHSGHPVELAIGHVVRLRGAEVRMTILFVDGDEVECGWFDVTDNFHRDHFSPAVLRPGFDE